MQDKSRSIFSTGGLAVDDQNVGHRLEVDLRRSSYDVLKEFTQTHFTAVNICTDL